ncbi:MAG: hypothetical protein ABJG41_12070 [Cyclobacteriaceae bacterium]
MKSLSIRTNVVFGLLFFLLIATLSSCTANKPSNAWMDLPHARELDHKKGNKSKKIQRHVARNQKH